MPNFWYQISPFMLVNFILLIMFLVPVLINEMFTTQLVPTRVMPFVRRGLAVCVTVFLLSMLIQYIASPKRDASSASTVSVSAQAQQSEK